MTNDDLLAAWQPGQKVMLVVVMSDEESRTTVLDSIDGARGALDVLASVGMRARLVLLPANVPLPNLKQEKPDS